MKIKTLKELQKYIDDLAKKHKITHYQIDGIDVLNLQSQIKKLDKSKGESVVFYPIIRNQREHEVGVTAVVFIEEKTFLKKELTIENE